MNVIKRCIELLGKYIHKIRFSMKLRRMDEWWHFMGGGCFGLFPPSFYYTHTEEEIKCAAEETLAEMQAMLDEYIAENNLKPRDKQ